MTPQELERRISALEREIELLKSSSTIPFDIGESLRDRVISETFKKTTVSSPSADGYLEANIGGELIYLPKYK
jgi:bacillopeptidase F (M6 metalloprotease family)